jgi:hypothetical protein
VKQDIEKNAQFVQHKLAKLAKEQGVKPVAFKALLATAPGGPDDETADDMIASIYEWRRRSVNRSLESLASM